MWAGRKISPAKETGSTTLAKGKTAMPAGSELTCLAQLLSVSRSAWAGSAVCLRTSLNRKAVEDTADTIYLALQAALAPSGDLTTGIGTIRASFLGQEVGTRQPRRELEGT